MPLDSEEQILLESVENDEWNSLPNLSQEIQRYQQYAQRHVNTLEEVKVELPIRDLHSLQALAQTSGISVSLLIASVIHQYVSQQSSSQS